LESVHQIVMRDTIAEARFGAARARHLQVQHGPSHCSWSISILMATPKLHLLDLSNLPRAASLLG
jgi:hypothetical protein